MLIFLTRFSYDSNQLCFIVFHRIDEYFVNNKENLRRNLIHNREIWLILHEPFARCVMPDSVSLNYSISFNPKIRRSVLYGIPELGFRGGQGVRVAVIDSGVNNNVQVADEVDYTGFGTSDGISPGTHGTLVANIIKHLSKNCEIINIKVTQTRDNVNWAYVMKGLAYARDNGAQIVNMSLGCFSDKTKIQCSGKCAKCQEVQAYAKKAGLIIVAAAGNEGPGEGTINCPAVASDVIAVGMTNYVGSDVDDISSRSVPGTSKPNLLTSGYVALNSANPIGGTSFAAPVISGVLASALPVFNYDVTTMLTSLYNACEEIPQVPKHHQGHGKLNLNKFVEEIRREAIIVDRQEQSRN